MKVFIQKRRSGNKPVLRFKRVVIVLLAAFALLLTWIVITALLHYITGQ